jgi:thymidylate synthase (FAD)
MEDKRKRIELTGLVSTPVNRKNINNDDIGYIEQYDFSTSNSSLDARIEAITTVASVCYQNPKALGSISLYDRLVAESHGLPSSSFEFIPVLLDIETLCELLSDIGISDISDILVDNEDMNIYKFGEVVNFEKNEDDALCGTHLLTNLRAVIEDFGPEKAQEDIFINNSEEEIRIIKENFKVFKMDIDLSTRAQYIRHRTAEWQELSRRYVSGKKKEFSFFISKKMKDVQVSIGDDGTGTEVLLNMEDVININLDFYNNAIKDGVKPEEARRILPQAMYTTVWSAWKPKALKNFFKLRLDDHAQIDIRNMAEAKKALIEEGV